jgi:hypothetical protein
MPKANFLVKVILMARCAMGGAMAILDLSCGLPPFGRVPGLRLQILDLKN